MEENNIVKITHRAYEVLDFLPDGDPLKNKAKEKVLAILENITIVLSAKERTSLKTETALAMILDDIEILKNYLRIAKNQGWIGNINFLILVKEYDAVKNTIKLSSEIINRSLEVVYNPPKKDVLQLQDGSQKSSKEDDYISINQNYSERQKKILNMLSKTEKAQVSDFIKELPDITKRTIRRDLDDLLRKGEVVRIGEWNQVFYILPIENSNSNKKNSDMSNFDRTL